MFRIRLNKAIEYCVESEAINIPHTYANYPNLPTKRFNQPLRIDKADIPFLGFKIVDGVIELNCDPVFSIFINERIDLRRIKNCQNCENFFWAKCLNKNAENVKREKCSNAMRQKKRFVEKNKEEINAKRRETCKSKKEQEEGGQIKVKLREKNKNGTL